jgi:hypothetical protein
MTLLAPPFPQVESESHISGSIFIEDRYARARCPKCSLWPAFAPWVLWIALMCKSGRCTFVPNITGSASQDVSSNTLMTFLLLSVPAYLANVQFERVVGVPVECWTASEKDPPVLNANRGHILVGEWERRAPRGRRPQSRRERARRLCFCVSLPAGWCECCAQD